MSTIQSIERAFSILKIVTHHPDGVRLMEISKQTGLAKSTTSRILSTLESLGAVQKMENGRFQTGPTIGEMVGHLPTRRILQMICRPFMITLAEQTGETVALTQQDGLQVYYLENVQSQQAVRVRDWVDEFLPLHVSSSGKVFMAHWSEAELDEFLKRPLPVHTTHTITNPQKLRTQLQTIRDTKIATISQEQNLDVSGISTPIYNKSGQLVAALNLYGPTFRLEAPDKWGKFQTLLLETAELISPQLD